MYIITGLGRCGTSILTKYLNKCGYGIGRNVNWHEEARAGLKKCDGTILYNMVNKELIHNG